ncbi:MAG: hypothetical protein AAGG11_18170 [Pseudomonadota bacterium]
MIGLTRLLSRAVPHRAGALAAVALAAVAMAAQALAVQAPVAVAAVDRIDSEAATAQRTTRSTKPPSLAVTARVTLGPAPTGADAATLVAEDGLFIDLRTDADLEDKGYVPILGLHRQRLPIAELQDADRTSRTLRAMLTAAGNRTVWIGCNSGNRAALAWAILKVQEGATPAEALTAVNRLVTHEPLRRAILNR